MQEGNEKKLEEMRKTVDEKLNETLEKRLGESFKQVVALLSKYMTCFLFSISTGQIYEFEPKLSNRRFGKSNYLL